MFVLVKVFEFFFFFGQSISKIMFYVFNTDTALLDRLCNWCINGV